MAYKKSKYDAVCYYADKIMGRCTVADSEAYTVLMNACGGDAASVLREYDYFSPELKTILEKVAALQAGITRKQSSVLFSPPENSPWGDIQTCDALCQGVFMVSTASHGGTMVSRDMTAALSPAARKYGMRHNGFLCFEEDCDEAIVLRELLDKKLWAIPDRIRDKAAFEEDINKGLREYHPEYWKARQMGREKEAARQTQPVQVYGAEL